MKICETIQETILTTAGAAAGAGLAAMSGAIVATTTTAGLLYGATGGIVFSVASLIGEKALGFDDETRDIAASVLAIFVATILTPLILGAKTISLAMIGAGVVMAAPAALGVIIAIVAMKILEDCLCAETPNPRASKL